MTFSFCFSLSLGLVSLCSLSRGKRFSLIRSQFPSAINPQFHIFYVVLLLLSLSSSSSLLLLLLIERELIAIVFSNA